MNQRPAAVDSTPVAPLEVFFDGACALCAREIGWLARRAAPARVRYVDIASPDFDVVAFSRPLEQLMGRMHVRRAGDWLVGMAAFRALYEEAGLARWIAPTGWPVLRPIFDALYGVFARIRPYLPRRASACEGRCAVGAPSKR